MGIFGQLFGKKEKKLRGTDVVWQKKGTKLRQLLEAAEKAKKEGNRVFIAYYFKQSYEEFKETCHSGFYEITDPQAPPATGDTKTAAISYDLLKDPSKCYRLISKVKERKIKILFMEHYPLYSTEKTIEDNLRQIEEKEIQVNYFISLDDPLMAKFTNSNMKEILSKLGIGENESISHSMIDRSIFNLQEKFGKKNTYEYKTDSIEAWIKKNYPDDIY